MAPVRPAELTEVVTMTSTIPEPTGPRHRSAANTKAATKLKNDAMTASPGDSTRVDTTVAINWPRRGSR